MWRIILPLSLALSDYSPSDTFYMNTQAPEIVNKVKQSKLITIDLEKWVDPEQIFFVDLKEFLFKGLIVKEQEFRDALAVFDTSLVRDKVVRLDCSVETILPKWAWVLAKLKLAEAATAVHIGNLDRAIELELLRKIKNHDWDQYRDGFVILKGCSTLDISGRIYAEAAYECSLRAKKVMYGEACSNVPLFKTS
jgi:hypothetical protein